MITNAVVWIVLNTVATLPSVREALQFDPALFGRRPWTLITYVFVHPTLLGLGGALMLLAAFGPHVEQRMGKLPFLRYYLACGVGAAIFGLGLTSFAKVGPLSGSDGAILGIALAFWFAWPEARLVLDPIPVRPRARTLLLLFVGYELAAALAAPGTQPLAYLGGLACGYAILRVQSIRNRRVPMPPVALPARPVMKPVPVGGGQTAPARPPRPLPSPDPFPAEELDRVLDKISASGLQSLTQQEREFLDQVSERKRKHPG